MYSASKQYHPDMAMVLVIVHGDRGVVYRQLQIDEINEKLPMSGPT